MPQQFEVKLVIQGGGAKLSALLAALEELSAQKDLKVTRICGTSAGAIAACLFAAGVSPGDIRMYLLQHAAEFLSAYKLPSLGVAATKLAWDNSKALWSEAPFRTMLHHFLGNQFVTFADFKRHRNIVVEVVSVNVVNGVPTYHGDEANIVDSVLHSSGLPFLFRMNSPVDGGLCENLPVERLLAINEPGKVIAISFRRDEPTLPDGMFAFMLAMVNTVISNSVERSKALLPKNAVLEIETAITTFDFAGAVNPSVGLGSDYAAVREQAKTFFQDYVAAERRGAWTVPPHWETENPSAIAAMENSYLAYRILQKSEPITPHKISFEVTANSLFDKTHPLYKYDEVRYSEEFEVETRLSCIGVGIVAPPGTAYLNLSDWRIELLDGTIIRDRSQMIAVPLRDPEHPKARRIGFFFEPLVGKEIYRFIFEDMGNQLMKELADTGKDVVGFTTWKEGGETGVVSLILLTPNQQPYDRLRISCGQNAALTPHRGRNGYTPYHCQSTKVPAGTRVYFNLEV